MSRRNKNQAVRPTLPAVNLLSESAFARMAARRLRRRFVAGGFVLVLVVAAAWSFQHVRVAEAHKLVAVEQAETNRLTGQTQVLAPVRTFVNGVALQERTVQDTMAGEVYLSDVLEGIRDATPGGAHVTTLAVTVGTAVGATGTDTQSACPGPDPFNTRTVVGCVTLSGTASSRAEVGDMVVQLGHSALFVEPFISTTTTGDSDEVTFSGSVGLSEKVFSKRYGAPAQPAQPAQPATDGGS